MATRRPLVRVGGKLQQMPAGDSVPLASALAEAVALQIGSTSKDFDGLTGLSWTLGEIGAQPENGVLTLLSSVTPAAGKLPYFSGNTTMDVTDLTFAGRQFIGAASASQVRLLLDLYADGSGVMTNTSGALTNFVSLFLRSADAAAARTQLGIGSIPQSAVSTVMSFPASRALVLSDNAAYLRPNSPVTITVPTNTEVPFPTGAEVTIRAGQSATTVTIAPAAGVTIFPPAGGTMELAPGMTAFLKKISANAWDLCGQTVPA